ncbi:MAG: hypothetical protein JF621_29295, partial [Streptomyces turgidiscabies]|nr:hypothetical protein [Streptomyces turgidiscabies]
MPVLTHRGPAVAALTAGALLLCPAQAFAGYGHGGSSNGSETVAGGQDGQNLSATAGAVVYDRSKNGSGQGAGPVAATTSWTPPACWYAPTYTPEQLQKVKEPVWAAESTGYEWDAEQRKTFLN